MLVEQKEKDSRTGTTLLHATESIELSVSTPPHEKTQIPKRRTSLTKSFVKMRLFRMKFQSLQHAKDAKKNASNENHPADHQNVVITPKSKRSALKIDTSRDQVGAMPQVMPLGSSYSDDTVTPCHTNVSSNIADHSIAAMMEEPPQETYFLMTDFAKINWMETVTSHSTESLSLGFISVMAAAVVIHPILFVTGAATAVWAVGVVHAVEKGYEFFSDGQFKNMFWADSEVEQFQSGEEDESDNHGISDMNQSTPIDISSPSKDSNRFNSLSPLPILTSPLMTPLAHIHKRHVTSLDAAIVSHFPQLDTDVVSAEFPGLNALEFFHVFFSDDAPYSYKEFQHTTGDVDIQYGKWKKSNANPCSFHPNVKAAQCKSHFPTCSRNERVLRFKTLAKSYFGPAYASAKKTQQVTKFSTRLVIMESKTELFDIPYSDRFFILERWVIESTKHDKKSNPSMLYTTKLSVSVQVFMLKSCNWERQIRSKTLSTMTSLVTSWSEKATQALDLTLKRKLERMRVQHDMQDTRSLYSYRSKESRIQKAKHAISPVSTKKGKLPISPGKAEQALMKIHQRQLKLLEKKIASGDLEWCSIEMKHCMSAGEGRAFAKVLNPGGVIGSIVDEEDQDSDRPLEISIRRKSMKPKKMGGMKRLILRNRKNAI
eukprot:scaffold1472_cov245-Chaetoceros_neogracile.AAC.7